MARSCRIREMRSVYREKKAIVFKNHSAAEDKF